MHKSQKLIKNNLLFITVCFQRTINERVPS